MMTDHYSLFVMSHGPGKNPYRPGVGTRPAYLAGRESALRSFDAILRGAPEQAANLRVTGLRGVGKTVLLAEFAERARSNGWIVVSLELGPRHGTEHALVDTLAARAAEAREALSRVTRIKSLIGHASRAAGRVGISYDEIKVSVDVGSTSSNDTAQRLARELYDTLALVEKHERAGLLLLLDEAQVLRDERDRTGSHPLSLLISTVSALQRTEPPLPLGLVLCGLPTLVGNLLRARSYTERMFRGHEVGRLEETAARDAFIEPLRSTGVEADENLVTAVVREVEGYPYFVQLWGAELWEAAQSAELTRLELRLLKVVRPDIHRRLDLDFYAPRIDTLTPSEQDVLLATAACRYPPLRAEDLKTHLEKTPGNVNVLLGRLVEAGVLYRLRKGEYDYTAPKFREYLLRRKA
jgi:hypothetical protein